MRPTGEELGAVVDGGEKPRGLRSEGKQKSLRSQSCITGNTHQISFRECRLGVLFGEPKPA
jgi:hypothetical protein